MSLRLYNTRTRKKEAFEPLDPDMGVRMYVCGPTVYDYAHIGNARPVIVFDVLYRLLRHLAARGEWGEGVGVKYVRNITDVDDKINARAAEEGVPIRDLTERTTEQFHADMDALGCLRPDVEPRATDHIDDMKAMIERLVEVGCAYVAEDHVLFAVSSRPDYGSLSRRPLDEMKAGARVEIAPYKRDPMDFVLWKPSKDGEPGWDSPCGIEAKGRPGWHIECSAMADRHLGEVFDIHGGGIDLQFPHHENERAQSCCAHQTDVMANFWLHNGYLMVEGEKMSKSLGNFITVRDLLDRWPGEVIRLAMLMTHYRKPLDFSQDRLLEASSLIREATHAISNHDPRDASEDEIAIGALSDDLNTHLAVEKIKYLSKKSRYSYGEEALNAKNKLLWLLRFLGFERLVGHQTKINFELDKAISGALGYNVLLEDETSQKKIEEMIEARNEARKAKNFAEADRIRDELSAMGIQLKDSRDPKTGEETTTWEIAR